MVSIQTLLYNKFNNTVYLLMHDYYLTIRSPAPSLSTGSARTQLGNDGTTSATAATNHELLNTTIQSTNYFADTFDNQS